MLSRFIVLAVLLPATTITANAQCFNRETCDPDLIEIRSQLTISIPLAESSTQAEKVKAMDDASKSLQAVASHECDSIKTSIAGDCTISQINMNSSLQERGMRVQSAFASVSYTYQIKRAK